MLNSYLIIFLTQWYNYFILGWKPLTFSIVCLGIAMLCKEQGITIAGVCALYEVFVAQKVK